MSSSGTSSTGSSSSSPLLAVLERVVLNEQLPADEVDELFLPDLLLLRHRGWIYPGVASPPPALDVIADGRDLRSRQARGNPREEVGEVEAAPAAAATTSGRWWWCCCYSGSGSRPLSLGLLGRGQVLCLCCNARKSRVRGGGSAEKRGERKESEKRSFCRRRRPPKHPFFVFSSSCSSSPPTPSSLPGTLLPSAAVAAAGIAPLPAAAAARREQEQEEARSVERQRQRHSFLPSPRWRPLARSGAALRMRTCRRR